MSRLIVIFLLAAPLAGARAGNFLPHARAADLIWDKAQQDKPEAPRVRGEADGDYDVEVTGHYTGAGTATVGDTLTLAATVRAAGSDTDGSLTVTGLVITNGYFKGNGTIMGIPCTVEGRVDLPSAQDDEQTRRQSVTGRITGTFKDAKGNVGRIVAVQKIAGPEGSRPLHPKNGGGSAGGGAGSGGSGGAGSGGGDGNGSGGGDGVAPPPGNAPPQK